jgi:ankyrin repeat protein
VTDLDAARRDFIDASLWHGSLERANAILAAHPGIAGSDIYTSAILGDDESVRRFLANDPSLATSKGGPRNLDALTCLCFSKYLRLTPERTPGFMRAAEALLDAGASATAGFYDESHQPEPEFESVLYGAAGVAHHAPLTRLLLAHGADANDIEAVYHSPETYDNDALKALVETGTLTADSLAIMLVRKHDWHDYDGAKWLLEHGADPNRVTRWKRTPFHQAILRDNAIEFFALCLDHRADPTIATDGVSVAMIAARRGRGDVLDLFEQRGLTLDLRGVDRLLAGCARNDAEAVRTIATAEPKLVRDVVVGGGKPLADFAGNGNAAGVAHLLDLGVDVAATFNEGDGYWDVAPGSMALHVAAWRARHKTVQLLVERGAPVDAPDGKGRTALALAVRACVDSYWMERRAVDSVRALLQAGAAANRVEFPSGYDEVDELLASHPPGRDPNQPSP